MPYDPIGDLDDTQRMLRDSVAALVERGGAHGRVRQTRGTETGFDRTAWAEMAEAGLFGLLLPEATGGLGLGLAELSVVMHQLGRGLAPEPVAAAIVLAGGAIAYGDQPETKAALLPKLVDGSLLPALAWQESHGVYGVDGTATVLTGGKLSGRKRFVVGAKGADGFLVTAAGEGGVGLHWVEAGAGGITVEGARQADGTVLADVVFADAPVARLVASPTAAGPAIARVADEARLAAAAELVGVMEKSLEITLDYVKQRQQFGKAIGSFQALQHRIVDIWTQQELARSSVRAAVKVFDDGVDLAARVEAVSAAKARASDAGALVTRQGVQLHGGMGYTDECDIGLFMKRALVLAAWLGNGTAMRRRYAELALED
jgi:alkylation response protein AidB-like acyl-CoA dehydrogenase